ncbi:hypothetical protein MY3296_009503 [Beauveria thailandica]
MFLKRLNFNKKLKKGEERKEGKKPYTKARLREGEKKDKELKDIRLTLK